MILKDGEIIEDLQYKGLKIIRNKNCFSFGTDSVLLSSFVRCYSKSRVVDLGSGTGIISILVNGRTGASIDAVEIQSEIADMSMRSVKMNGQNNIYVHNMDMKNAPKLLERTNFDCVMCNPPYYNAGERSTNDSRAISIHQDSCTIGDVAKVSRLLLKSGGNAFIVYPASRFLDAINEFKKEAMELKRIRAVTSVAGKSPYLMLMEFKKDAKSGVIWENELVISNKDGTLTDEAKAVYHIEN